MLVPYSDTQSELGSVALTDLPSLVQVSVLVSAPDYAQASAMLCSLHRKHSMVGRSPRFPVGQTRKKGYLPGHRYPLRAFVAGTLLP